MSKPREFSRLRTFFWPVHVYELKKLLPMLAIIFLISFAYNILRNIKDPLVITAPGSGAEIIPFIKVWVMFPMAVLLTMVYTKLSNRYHREKVFYLMVTLFLAFFTLFTFFMYPARELLHSDQMANTVQSFLPGGASGFVAMFRNWTFTAYYAMAELWGAIILSLAFWGFANEVTKVKEAKRFYGLFGLGANLSGVVSGHICNILIHNVNSILPFYGEDSWEKTLVVMTGVVVVCGALIMVIFRWMNKVVLADPRFMASEDQVKRRKPKVKMSLMENFRYLARSKYLLCIAFIVVAYNVCINLVEVVWKDQVKQQYSTAIQYNEYMNNVSIATGFIAAFIALIVAGNSIRKFGWTFTAMLTPAVILLTGIGFFGFLFLGENATASEYTMAVFGLSPLMLVVFFGGATNALSRASKYTVFDATKEIAFIPLSDECRLKGKAAIDGVGSRLGKSGGSIIHQSLLMFFTTLTASAPYVAGILAVMLVVWMIAVRVLGKQFNNLVEHHEVLEINENETKDAAKVVPENTQEEIKEEEKALV